MPTDSDLREVNMFQQFLHDLHSDMPAKDFAIKWAEYLDITRTAAEAYRRNHQPNPAKESVK